MKKQWNNKRGMALFLGAAVAATTILAVPFHGNGFAESKAAASEKTVPVRKAPAATATQASVATATPAPTATSKPYGDKLKLNKEIKLNATKSYVKKGYVKETTLFPKKKTVKVKYSISCKRKSAGNKYKVTYKVKYKFLNDPKISGKRMSYEDWALGWYHPTTLYTVFDYQTGKSIEKKNNLGVKVKGGKWKYSYYPKQYFKYTDQTTWIQNQKTVSYQFTVTYPKNCKDVVVGIGFFPEVYDFTEAKDTDYWNRKEVYGKTSYYKKGRKTISYMRLN